MSLYPSSPINPERESVSPEITERERADNIRRMARRLDELGERECELLAKNRELEERITKLLGRLATEYDPLLIDVRDYLQWVGPPDKSVELTNRISKLLGWPKKFKRKKSS